ncbi:transmembrane protein, putative [Bodo saltans]|uniref:Transmembrane protein, putative n=1 Tax=Bodo saltans TaxID=75058 RepID=A0A0S4JFV4_BODSA|nr:transmembrane protein, putative [Bodo saltans]|eukprot:CUG88837.1 transmembrane protein, putative [Bodo saltans]
MTLPSSTGYHASSPTSSSSPSSALSSLWQPVIAAKGTRTSGRHFVKWTGPNVDASMMVASRACPLLLAGHTANNNKGNHNSSSTPSNSLTSLDTAAAAAATTSIPIITVGKSESPIGFHLLHTPRSAFHATSNNTLSSSSSSSTTSNDIIGAHVLMLLEPGSLIWSCGVQPDRHSLLQELTSIVTIAQLVAATSRGGSCVFPNHLVIAPHGWPADAPKKAEQELYDWLFKLEATVGGGSTSHHLSSTTGTTSVDLDAVQRNDMRLKIESAFLSMQVFAFPDPETLQYRDRIDQCFRSRWVAGCLEGWGVPAAPPTTVHHHSTSGDVDVMGATTGPSAPAAARFPPIIYADVAQKLARVQRVLNVCISSSTSTTPFGSSIQTDLWLKDRMESTIDADFVQHCAARKSRMTSQQAWEAHDLVLARCRRVAELELVSCADVRLELAKTSEAALDTKLQHVLVTVQEVEEERRKLQLQRQAAASQNNDRRFGIGDNSDTIHRELWMAEHVQKWVPRRYWFWFTTQGLGVMFVFLSLLLYTFWPRKS